MRILVSGSQMKEIDRYTIKEIGIPSMVLMERAAMAVVEQTKLRCDRKDRIWAVCGPGNNGADGIAAARMLHLEGYRIFILLCGDPDRGTEEYRRQLEIAKALEVPMARFHDFIPGGCDVILDGIFGVGLAREIEGEYREAVEMLESRNAREVIAIDIPSGVHGDTGRIMGTALKASVTVTFGYEKLGTVLYPGKSYCGDVVVADIGFPRISYEKSLHGDHGIQFFTYEEEDADRRPGRPSDANKGTFGKVLVVAGSKNMSGAAYLSALAAYRVGAGLVKILTVEENREILQTQLPEAILETYDPWREPGRSPGNQGPSAGQRRTGCEPASREPAALPPLKDQEFDDMETRIADACSWATVIVLGPGVGREPYVERLVKSVLVHAYVPIIIDADGLNTIAAHPELTRYYTENIIITPHVGEMARLTGRSIGEIKDAPIDTALDYSSLHGITCVLKDAVTVVTGKEGLVYLNTSGSSAMAKAGTGDVLAGTVAGLLAQGEENFEAAVLGVHLHGLAGDRCLLKYGPHGLLAGDLTNELGVK